MVERLGWVLVHSLWQFALVALVAGTVVRAMRRYSAAELRNKLSLVGFEVGKVSYVLFFLFFPVLVFRILTNIFKKNPYPKTAMVALHPLINWLLVLLNRIEMSLLSWINYPFGVTIVAVARKPEVRP